MNATPADDELAAIAAALASLRSVPATAVDRRSGWATAAHYPGLEFDELHALVRGCNGPCSTRF